MINTDEGKVLSKSDAKRVKVLKTSKWDKDGTSTAPPNIIIPKPPEWVTAYTIGSSIYHEGWESFVRHVGCEDGHWLVLIEPVRKMNRAARRREGRNA